MVPHSQELSAILQQGRGAHRLINAARRAKSNPRLDVFFVKSKLFGIIENSGEDLVGENKNLDACGVSSANTSARRFKTSFHVVYRAAKSRSSGLNPVILPI